MSSPRQAAAENESDAVANVLGVLRRRWLLIVGIVIACVAVAAVKHIQHREELPGDVQRLLPERHALGLRSPGDALRDQRTTARSGHRGSRRALARSRGRGPQAASPEHVRQRTAQRGEGRSGPERRCPEHHRRDRRPEGIGEPGQCVRGTVHRVPGAIRACRHQHRRGKAAAAGERTPGGIGRTRDARAVPSAAWRAKGGRGRRSQHHRPRDAAGSAIGYGPVGDRADRAFDRPGDSFLAGLPDGVARPQDQVDRGVRARVQAARADRGSAVRVPFAARR